MRRFLQWVMAAALICGTSVFMSSCSKDDDNPVNRYRLVQRKDVYADTDKYHINHYSYDDQGRLASFVRYGYNTEWGDIIEANYTYTYGDHYIKEYGKEGYDYYTLNDDGLIVKHESIRVTDGVESATAVIYYQYDNGRITSYSENEPSVKYLFHWKDGDLMSYGIEERDDAVDVTEYTWSALTVDHGYREPPLTVMREPLYMMGYYGKASKHLESHKKKTGNNAYMSLLYDYDYTYTIDKGHIVEMVDNYKVTTEMGAYKSETINSKTYTFTYEEY